MGDSLKGSYSIFLLLAVFAAAAVIVNPVGNFPLDDDFAYGRTVLNFLNGDFRISGWISATVVFQTFVGVLFSLPFGFSFTALRFSSVFMAFLGAAAAYMTLKELKFGEKLSMLGAFALLFNPLYFSKAFNFHSDIHFMAMMLLSVLFYVKAVNRNNSSVFLFLGSLFSVFAILIRQNGLFIPAAVVAYLCLNRKARRFSFSHFAVVALVPLAAFMAYEYWFYFVHGVTESGSLMSQYDVSHIMELVFRLIPFRFFSIFAYLGLLLLPFTFIAISRLDKFFLSLRPFDRKLFLLLVFAGIFSAVFLFVGYGKVLFYLPTTIHVTGLGPVYLQGLKNPVFPQPILGMLAVLSIVSGAVIAIRAKSALSGSMGGFGSSASSKFADARFLVYFVGFFQLLFLMAVLAVFDRYLLPLFFPAIVLLLGMKDAEGVKGANGVKDMKAVNGVNDRLFSFRSAAILVVFMALFSVAATQDYLSWNRARYAAISGLSAQGIPPGKIDGGFEHGAWNFYEFSRAHPEINNSKPYDPGWIRDYFPVIDSQYVVSFTPLSNLSNYSTLREYSYFSMLTMRTQKMHVLKRA
ncbi:glycosyltransferase family 39 protein [Candidatus Woesearchaeota archaeon]|nr:glycosyltransferase family 39 protein [Candidatus Woesearchaeota archaeon]